MFAFHPFSVALHQIVWMFSHRRTRILRALGTRRTRWAHSPRAQIVFALPARKNPLARARVCLQSEASSFDLLFSYIFRGALEWRAKCVSHSSCLSPLSAYLGRNAAKRTPIFSRFTVDRVSQYPAVTHGIEELGGTQVVMRTTGKWASFSSVYMVLHSQRYIPVTSWRYRPQPQTSRRPRRRGRVPSTPKTQRTTWSFLMSRGFIYTTTTLSIPSSTRCVLLLS